ncbi:MAG: tetratricopeptide repeat protein [Succinivibrionaceae bacterium]|nr:tetratricopeptide repeat protein [Succinivibrionaceae bacterium]
MDAADRLSAKLDFDSQDSIPLKNKYFFGVMFYRGQGVPQSYEEAAKWFSRVISGPCRETPNQAVKEPYAESGSSRNPQQDAEFINSAQYYLGFMYFNGQGVAQNYDEAARHLLQAAQQGHAEAQNLLGRAYFRGQGRKQSFNEAVKWWSKAAEQGQAEAQNSLGDAYCKGKGTEQNYKTAVTYYRKAAKQGHSGAETSLGDMYKKGLGVDQDTGEAVKWYWKAAEHGYADARSRLEEMFSTLPKPEVNLVHR